MIRAVIIDLDALISKGSITPLPGAAERLAHIRAQQLPIAITTNPNKLIAHTAEQQATAPDSFSAAARVAASIKEISHALDLQQVPWFLSLGDPTTQETMSAQTYQATIEQIKQEMQSLFPQGALYVSQVTGPAPAMLLAITQHFQVPPAECLYIGTSAMDKQAANAAGLPFELV
ncbi:HAD-hyrolase-like protein [Thermosporothrix hazakensis]|jgi:beta-phosphoglucomutase-like phosphatase (HAD superfamily)|uniref:HAD-hyrolase-like protein n=2 Tax=Thermosporothrix TaxID=768650 RepID=A0A326U3S8_THEHA|nr:HAD family hydrolase [Thermosporothrix hazakensis]PZW27098.1 HAD-hyrolase-like protein [Thermosporothrix hazakensis]GCE50382.1 hypothetical protein KTH_52510 [Thermosporothrix hazakensis]